MTNAKIASLLNNEDSELSMVITFVWDNSAQKGMMTGFSPIEYQSCTNHYIALLDSHEQSWYATGRRQELLYKGGQYPLLLYDH